MSKDFDHTVSNCCASTLSMPQYDDFKLTKVNHHTISMLKGS